MFTNCSELLYSTLKIFERSLSAGLHHTFNYAIVKMMSEGWLLEIKDVVCYKEIQGFSDIVGFGQGRDVCFNFFFIAQF